MRVKSKDIADALNLSPATVSLVLNDRPGVNRETRKRVLDYIDKIEKMEAVKNRVSQVENKGTILMLNYIKTGYIMKRDNSSSNSHFYSDMEYLVNSAGYRFESTEFYERFDSMDIFLEHCIVSNVKGIYLMAAEMEASDMFPFKSLDIPIVTGDNLFYEQGFDSYLVDNFEGISRGVDYLIDKGHTHIVYLAENSDIFNFMERRSAFIKEMAARECGDSQNRIWKLGNNMDEIYDNIGKHIDEGLKKTTAFILESSMVSLAVSKALLERNIRVPRDISLLGFDAVPDLSIPGISLTLIKGTHTKRHIAAIKHLIRHIENKEDEIVRIYYRTRLIEGDSVFDKKRFIYK